MQTLTLSAHKGGTAEPAGAGHIPHLDGFRGVACLMVLIGHATLKFQVEHMPDYAPAGVYLFFTLSGFLITRNLLTARNDGPGILSFFVKRAARLWPVFYVALALTTLAAFHHDWWVIGLYAANFTPRHMMPVFAHTWSLCVEEHYYLVWPWLVWFLPRMWSRGVMGGVVLLSLPLVLATLYLGHALGGFEGKMLETLQYRATTCNLMGLALGSMIAMDEQWWRQGRRLLVLGLAVAVVAVAIATVMARLDPGNLAYTRTISYWRMQAVCGGLFCIVLSGTFEPLSDLLRNRWLCQLGLISYGVYVYHYPIFVLISTRVSNSSLMAKVAIVTTLLVSAASYRCMEKPVQQWARRMLAARSARPTVAGTITEPARLAA